MVDRRRGFGPAVKVPLRTKVSASSTVNVPLSLRLDVVQFLSEETLTRLEVVQFLPGGTSGKGGALHGVADGRLALRDVAITAGTPNYYYYYYYLPSCLSS